MGEWVDLFKAEGIDGDALFECGDQDLKDLGITKFGHRKKMMKVIGASGRFTS